LSVLCFSAFAACGGDDVDCSFTACGGDPTGVYEIDGVCADNSDFLADIQEDCPQATGGASVGATGTYDFAPDQSFSLSVNVNSLLKVTAPVSCFPNPLASCDQLEEDANTQCEGDPEVSCTCTVTQTDAIDQTGTWSTSGSTLTFDQGGIGSESLYCVEGNTLKIQSIPDQPDEVPSVLVLRK